MPEPLVKLPYDLSALTRTLVTEDDTPVDNFFSAKQRRLLVEPLYSSWQPPSDEEDESSAPQEPRKFLVDTDVGIFSSPYQPPIVPDMFLSLDVETNPEYFAAEHRAYFVWEFEKIPEVAVEIVSNRKGNEMDGKLRRYAHLGVTYYIVLDPFLVLGTEKLQVYELGFGRRYRPRRDLTLPNVGLSLRLWRGDFEGANDEWLRWCDLEGNLIPTGEERARAASEQFRIASEKLEATSEKLEAISEQLQVTDKQLQIVSERAEVAEARLLAETERANAEAVARQQMEDELARLRTELQYLKS